MSTALDEFTDFIKKEPLPLIIYFFMLLNYKKVNEVLDKNLNFKKKENEDDMMENKTNKNLLIKSMIYFAPIIYLLINRMKSMNTNTQTSYLLEILGAYGIIQVLSQDLGIKTGKIQRDLVQHPVSQFLLLFAGAYLVGNDLSESLIATLIFHTLKFNISNNDNSGVCFEDV